jgi:hypothetical protein
MANVNYGEAWRLTKSDTPPGIRNNMWEALKNEEFCDMYIQPRDGPLIALHRVVLWAGVPSMRPALKLGEYQEGKTGIIDMREYRRVTVLAFLEWLYTETLGLCAQDTDGRELWDLFEYKQVDKALAQMIEKVDERNISKVWEFATSYDDAARVTLKKACVKFGSHEDNIPMLAFAHESAESLESWLLHTQYPVDCTERIQAKCDKVLCGLILLKKWIVVQNVPWPGNIGDILDMNILTTGEFDFIPNGVLGQEEMALLKNNAKTFKTHGNFYAIGEVEICNTPAPECSIVACQDGGFILLNEKRNLLCRYNKDLKLLHTWYNAIEVTEEEDAEMPDTEKVHFGQMGRMAMSSNGDIFICDTQTCDIKILGDNYELKGVIGRKGSGDGEFNTLMGITFDHTGRLLVCDKGNHRVQILKTDGTFVGVFTHGLAENQFLPNCIAVSTNGEIFVTMGGSRSIYVFNQGGHYIRLELQPAEHGTALVASPNGGVLVADDKYHDIVEFGVPGLELYIGEIRTTKALAFNSKGQLFVACRGTAGGLEVFVVKVLG